MKNLLLVLPLFFLLFSCNKKTPLQQLINDADVVKLYIYSGDKVILHFETNDIGKIKKWKYYLADDSIYCNPDCSFNGKVIFKTSDDSSVMKLSLTNCQSVQYELDGINYCKSVTEKGRQYIDSLLRLR